MSLRVLSRRAKMDIVSMEGDVCELLFAHKRTQHVCRLFLDHLKAKGGLTRRELNRFSIDLEAGRVEAGLKYSRTEFYAQIRKTLLTLGLIAIEQRFIGSNGMMDLAAERNRFRDVVDKYVPVRQPIPQKPPDGLNLPRLVWGLCKRWNDEFLAEKKRTRRLC